MMEIENTQECFVMLWRKLERTRRLFQMQCRRFCIRRVLKSWFGLAANDHMIVSCPYPRSIHVSTANYSVLSWPSVWVSASTNR